MKNLIESALNLFFPPVCGMCDKLSDGYLCNYCHEYLRKQEKNRIDRYEDKYFSEHFWIYEYKNEIRERIIDYKFNGKSYIYRTFVELILKNESAVNYIKSFDIIIPVPIHKKRYKKRGYNQSELLTKAICRNFNSVQYRDKTITKIKNIPPQSSLDKQGRANNVLNAYAIRTKRLETLKQMAGSRILLVDDVYTTGSTLNECAKTLSKSVNAYICTFTIARD